MTKRAIAPLALLLLIISTSFMYAKEPRVLVFTRTKGYHHQVIAKAEATIWQMGREHHFTVDTTNDASVFTDALLKKYAAVIFLNTTGDVLDSSQQAAFERYIRSGRGFVGVHSATDTEYDWPWYNHLVGAQFLRHPKQQDAVFHVVDRKFPGMSVLPEQWKRFDELYNFKNFYWDEVHVLITIDEKTYTGGENGDFHPMAWYHDYDGGRAFYTELGHTEASYDDPLYLGHLLGGIEWAMGPKPAAASK